MTVELSGNTVVDVESEAIQVSVADQSRISVSEDESSVTISDSGITVTVTDDVSVSVTHSDIIATVSETAISTFDGDADTLDGFDSTYFLPVASYTAADVLAKLLTVDGTGSGLDADLLDGNSSAYFEVAGAATTAIAAHVAAADPHTGYLLATGTRAGASSQAQTFTNGIVIGSNKASILSSGAITSSDVNGTTMALVCKPNVSTGFFASMSFTMDQTNMSGPSGWNIVLADLVSGGSTRNGGSNWIRFRKDNIDKYTLNEIFETVIRPTSATGWGVIQIDGTNVTAATGILRVFNRQDGASFRNTLTTDDGSGVGFRFSVTTNSAYTSISNKSAKVIVAGNGQSSPVDVFFVRASGETKIDLDGSSTNSIDNALIINNRSSGTPTANYGIAIKASLESSTTNDRDAGRLSWQWSTATDASRAAKGKLTAYYTTTERDCIAWEANSTVPLIGFLGTAPVAKPTAYTQTYSTADRTIAARTAATLTDNTGGTVSTTLTAITAGAAYTQSDMVAVKDALASLADQLNKLQADHLDTTQGLNVVIDDLQAYGLLA